MRIWFSGPKMITNLSRDIVFSMINFFLLNVSYSLDICLIQWVLLIRHMLQFSRTHSHLKWRIHTSVFLKANETRKNKIGMRHAKCKRLSCVCVCWYAYKFRMILRTYNWFLISIRIPANAKCTLKNEIKAMQWTSTIFPLIYIECFEKRCFVEWRIDTLVQLSAHTCVIPAKQSKCQIKRIDECRIPKGGNKRCSSQSIWMAIRTPNNSIRLMIQKKICFFFFCLPCTLLIYKFTQTLNQKYPIAISIYWIPVVSCVLFEGRSRECERILLFQLDIFNCAFNAIR